MTTYIVNKTPQIATMRLYGEIGNKVDGDLFARELASLDETCDLIKIYGNSGGGRVDQGFSIISVMLSMSTPVHFQIDGLAASMTAVIAVCAEKVFMMDYSQLMIHDPSFSDDSKLTPKQKEILNLTKASLQKILSRRGCDETKVGELMTKETWFSAQQAKEVGLCDEIITSTRNKLKNIAPCVLEARITAEYKQTNTEEQMNNYEKIAAKLNLPKNSDETAIVDALDARETTLSAREKAIIDHYMKVGKEAGVITDKNKEKYERLAKADFELFVDQVTQAKAVENIAEKSDKRLSDVINNASGQEKKEGKNWKWFQENDPNHLEKLESTNPKEFKRMLDEYENSL